jgi:hypothetical protein
MLPICAFCDIRFLCSIMYSIGFRSQASKKEAAIYSLELAVAELARQWNMIKIAFRLS